MFITLRLTQNVLLMAAAGLSSPVRSQVCAEQLPFEK